jgi:hypothetical protein
VVSVAISDTAANVVANLTALESLAAAGKLRPIALIGTGTPALALTAAQFVAGNLALGLIASPCNIAVNGVVAATAAGIAGQAHVVSVAVRDTAANVVANLTALESLAAAGKLSAIALTATGSPALALTAAQYALDGLALGLIRGAYNIGVSGVTAITAAGTAGQPHVLSVAVSDTAANVVANLTALESLAAAGKLSAIALTDTGSPTLALTAAQYALDGLALGLITGAYNIGVSGVTAITAASTAIGSDRMQFINSTAAGETLAATPTTPNEFVFTNTAAGIHTITGFNTRQDIVELSGLQFASFTDVQHAITPTAGGALINLGHGASLLLSGVSSTTLQARDFAMS